MPKLKTVSSAKKRFKKTGNGGFKCRQGFRNHILTKKSTKRKRQLRRPKLVNASDTAAVRQMLPHA